MFTDVQQVQLDASHRLVLTRTGGQQEVVPRDCVQMILEVNQLAAVTELWNDEHGWNNPDTPQQEPIKGTFEQPRLLQSIPYPSIMPTMTRQMARARGQARLSGAKLYSFNSDGLFEIDEFTLRIEVSDKPGCKTMITEDGCEVICLLTDDQFSRLLRHIFLSSGSWKAQVVIGTIGFQRSADAAYSEGDGETFIIQSGRLIESELRRISVFNV